MRFNMLFSRLLFNTKNKERKRRICLFSENYIAYYNTVTI